jgi:hypothetical protein
VPGVHPVSLQSICLELVAGERVVGTATGFAVDAGSHPFLVTSWRVVTGRDNVTGQLLMKAPPDAVRIHHHGQRGAGSTTVVTEPLVDEDGDPLWSTHPAYGSLVDVVAFPLTRLDDVALHCRRLEDLGAGAHADVLLTSDVSVVGFPFGPRASGEPAVWTRGTVATEYDADYDGKPCFLVDARIGAGQGGSPVLVRSGPMTSGNGTRPTGPGSQLIGVYSARASSDTDLGVVWKSTAVVEVLVNAQSQVILRRFSAS